jgi:hypothetical protein
VLPDLRANNTDQSLRTPSEPHLLKKSPTGNASDKPEICLLVDNSTRINKMTDHQPDRSTIAPIWHGDSEQTTTDDRNLHTDVD